MRTMMNFVRQVGIAITAGIKPEFSLTYGRGDYDGMRRLYRKSLIYCTIGGATAVIVLLLAGQPIYEIWTRGEVPFSYTLFFPFCGYTTDYPNLGSLFGCPYCHQPPLRSWRALYYQLRNCSSYGSFSCLVWSLGAMGSSHYVPH